MYTVEKHNFVDCQALANSIINELNTNGFTLKHPVSVLADTYAATFEVSATTDPLYDTQPWRVRIEASSESRLDIFLGTNLQLPDTGGTFKKDDGINISGHLGEVTGNVNNPKKTAFIERAMYDAQQRNAYPMSYKLSIDSHGLALCIWEAGSDETYNNHAWFVAQRSVNNTTGAIRTTGRCPVFALFSIKRAAGVYSQGGAPSDINATAIDMTKRFIVREADVLRPTNPVDATVDSDDANRLIHKSQIVAMQEDGSFVILVPKELNTPRFAYPLDELDLIAYTSADVVAHYTDINLTMYGEAEPRTYRGLIANGPYNSGIRLLMRHA